MLRLLLFKSSTKGLEFTVLVEFEVGSTCVAVFFCFDECADEEFLENKF